METCLRVISQEEFQISTWSGGTTTQIAIGPKGAQYAQRNFDWRVSSAVVELEESDFTALPQYERWITVLEGKMVLRHGQGERIALSFGRVHSFDGGAATKSWGQCRDFNLMLRKGTCDGTMTVHSWCAGQEQTIRAEKEETVLCYCHEGTLCMSQGENSASVPSGQAVILEGCWKQATVQAQTDSKAIFCRIWNV